MKYSLFTPKPNSSGYIPNDLAGISGCPPKTGIQLESLTQGAKSETAQAEVAKMRRVLKGESVEAVTGMTLDQHRQRLYGNALGQ